jgi:4-alpha-glucanotransferase
MTILSQRSSGILLHITSLPGQFGIGSFGKEARAFVDFLVDSGQRWWQVLPLGPTGYGNSPYQSLSAFAGNTLLIDPAELIADELLSPEEIANGLPQDGQVDFEAVWLFKEKLLHQAFENFRRKSSDQLQFEFEKFCADSTWWLDDYACFIALKDDNDGREWSTWDPAIAGRQSSALAREFNRLHEEIRRQKFFQFLFYRQWQALRDYCKSREVRLIGDLPIFVAHDSADVWAHPEYFKLDSDGKPIVVAGVPPDYFSETGQLWGNPLYDWDRLRRDGFAWWIERVRFTLAQVDAIRVDHFRGFVACWEIPAGELTAENGQWVPSPGRELFATLNGTLGKLPIIAENLGVITPEVEGLREASAFPGMRVLQFAFGGDATNDHLPHNYTRDSVAYTGTHDNDTTVGWFAEIADTEAAKVCLDYLDSDGSEINWDFVRAVMASVAEIAIVPLQDVLGLGNEARMNLPASESGNWTWRLSADWMNKTAGERLRRLTELYGRK